MSPTYNRGRGGDLTARRATQSIFANAAEFGVLSVLVVVTTPSLLRGLGGDGYGLWIWATAVAVLLAQLLDPGTVSAGIRYLAALDPALESREVSAMSGAILVTNAFVGMLVGAAVIAVSEPVSAFAGVPASMREETASSLRVAGLLVAVTFLNAAVAALLRASQRLGVLSLVTGAANAVILVGSAVGALSGLRVHELLLWQLVASIVMGLVLLVLVEGYVPAAAPWRVVLEPTAFRSVVRYGGVFFLMSGAETISFQAVKIYLSAVAGASALAYFNGPYVVTSRIQGFIAKATQLVFPASSSIAEDGPALRTLYLFASRAAQIAVLAICVPLILFGDRTQDVWLGRQALDQTRGVMSILCASFMLLSYTTVPHFVLNGIGKAKVNLLLVLATTVTVAATATALIPMYGPLGAALALAAGSLTAVPALYVVDTRILHVRWSEMWRRVYLPGIVPALTIAVALRALPGDVTDTTSGLIIVLFVSSALIGLLGVMWAYIDDRDPVHHAVRTWVNRQRKSKLSFPA